MSTEFWIQMIVYGITFGVSAGIIKTKLSYIEKKLDKHNHVIERTYALEKHVSLLDEKQSVANHRIDDLEKNKNKLEEYK